MIKAALLRMYLVALKRQAPQARLSLRALPPSSGAFPVRAARAGPRTRDAAPLGPVTEPPAQFSRA